MTNSPLRQRLLFSRDSSDERGTSRFTDLAPAALFRGDSLASTSQEQHQEQEQEQEQDHQGLGLPLLTKPSSVSSSTAAASGAVGGGQGQGQGVLGTPDSKHQVHRSSTPLSPEQMLWLSHNNATSRNNSPSGTFHSSNPYSSMDMDMDTATYSTSSSSSSSNSSIASKKDDDCNISFDEENHPNFLSITSQVAPSSPVKQHHQQQQQQHQQAPPKSTSRKRTIERKQTSTSTGSATATIHNTHNHQLEKGTNDNDDNIHSLFSPPTVIRKEKTRNTPAHFKCFRGGEGSGSSEGGGGVESSFSFSFDDSIDSQSSNKSTNTMTTAATASEDQPPLLPPPPSLHNNNHHHHHGPKPSFGSEGGFSSRSGMFSFTASPIEEAMNISRENDDNDDDGDVCVTKIRRLNLDFTADEENDNSNNSAKIAPPPPPRLLRGMEMTKEKELNDLVSPTDVMQADDFHIFSPPHMTTSNYNNITTTSSTAKRNYSHYQQFQNDNSNAQHYPTLPHYDSDAEQESSFSFSSPPAPRRKNMVNNSLSPPRKTSTTNTTTGGGGWRNELPLTTPILQRKKPGRPSRFFPNNDYDDDDSFMNLSSNTNNNNNNNNKSRFQQDFEIMDVLGEGAFGTVNKCLSRLDGCLYAVKTTKCQAKGESARERMLKEVKALAALSDLTDPAAFHIVRYHQAWMEENRLYIQTELCTSTLLDEMKGGGAITRSTIRQYKMLREMLLALDLIHRKGMVHIDIKPENIFIKNEQFKLGDFGLVAKSSVHGDVEEGDSRYMCADLLQGKTQYLTKCDIFSLGATMYEIALGRPLPGDGQEWHDIRQEKLAPLTNTPSHLRKVIEAMMCPNIMNQRPSAAELLTWRQLLSEDQKRLILEKNRVREANMALAVQEARLKKLTLPNRKTLTRANTLG